jgi:ketosteroid isomerase-like protein
MLMLAQELGGRMTTTTPDAATTVRQLLEAFLAGDVETFMSYVDERVEWNPAEHHPFLTQQYRGRQQFLDGAVATVAQVLDGFRFDIQRVLACGEVAVSQLRYAGKIRSNGRSFDLPAAIIWEVRDGKVIRAQEYMDTWAFTDAWKAGS